MVYSTRLRTDWLILLVAMLACGCGPTAKDKLVGKWTGNVRFDDEAVQQRLEQDGNNPIKEAIVKKVMEALESGTLSLEFKADGSYTSTSRLGPFSDDDYGSWEVIDETAQRATIRMTSHSGKVQETSIVFADQAVISAPLTGQAAGLGEFRCTRQE
jgi:hypothetical protein